jgi:hypothetical protein
MLDAAYLETVNVARMSGTFNLQDQLRTQTTHMLQEEIHTFVYSSSIRKFAK